MPTIEQSIVDIADSALEKRINRIVDERLKTFKPTITRSIENDVLDQRIKQIVDQRLHELAGPYNYLPNVAPKPLTDRWLRGRAQAAQRRKAQYQDIYL